MKLKTQSIALALGGTITMLAMTFGKIEFSWVGFIYTAFCMIIGFMNWIEIDKETSNWAKQDKIYMGWLVNGWLIYGWLIEIWEGIIKSTSNWNKINKE